LRTTFDSSLVRQFPGKKFSPVNPNSSLTYYPSYCKLTLAREYQLVKLLSTLIFPKKSPLAVKIQSYLSEMLLIKLI
jgi:hypothetical protein